MRATAVSASVSFLLDPGLTATAKVLWLTLRHEGVPVGPKRLGTWTGFTQVTVRKGLAQLEAGGWYSGTGGAMGPEPSCGPRPWVSIPVGLLEDRRVRPHGRLLYGLLQTLPTFERASGEFTYPALSAHAQVSAVTARLAISDLVAFDWLAASQKNRKAVVQFTLCDPDLARRKQEVADATARLEEVEYQNEQIMKEYLSLLVDSSDYADNIRPGFLPNPESKKSLELDRYYPPSVGFEYNGVQHYHTTERFPSARALSERQFRDAVKRVLCEERSITLVVVTRRDLSLRGMQAKIGKLLPRRDLRGHEDLIEFLERLKK